LVFQVAHDEGHQPLAVGSVIALGERPGTAVGHEVVVDEVHRVGRRVSGQHSGGEGPLQRQRVGPVGQCGQPGP